MAIRLFFVFFYLSALVIQGVTSPTAYGEEIRPLYRGTRAMAMGGAYVALADDEQAVFLNPAGMAGFKKSEVHYLDMNGEASGQIYSLYQQGTGTFKSLKVSTVNSLLGHNVYFRGQISPTIVIPNVGIAMLVDGQAAFYGQNLAFPRITLGYQNTNGVQLATGFSLNRSRERVGRPDFRVGVGAKVLWRRGGYYKLTAIDLLKLTDGKSYLSQLVGNYQLGLGADVGTQIYYPVSKVLTWSFGAAYTEIGDIDFKGNASSQIGNPSAGLAMVYKASPILDIRLAYEFNHIDQDMDWRKKNHFGMEFDFPFIDLYGGINQVYFTYGASFGLPFGKVYLISYGEELGTFAHQNPDRRYMIRLDFSFRI